MSGLKGSTTQLINPITFSCFTSPQTQHLIFFRKKLLYSFAFHVILFYSRFRLLWLLNLFDHHYSATELVWNGRPHCIHCIKRLNQKRSIPPVKCSFRKLQPNQTIPTETEMGGLTITPPKRLLFSVSITDLEKHLSTNNINTTVYFLLKYSFLLIDPELV